MTPDYDMLGGFGWCQDSSGREAVNRAFFRGHWCKVYCDRDETCPGYVSAGTSGDCVLYTDNAFKSVSGREASTFQIARAGHTADQPWWASARCYRKRGCNPDRFPSWQRTWTNYCNHQGPKVWVSSPRCQWHWWSFGASSSESQACLSLRSHQQRMPWLPSVCKIFDNSGSKC